MARVALIKSSLHQVSNLLLTPPLGILYLASVLRNRGHQVLILDQRLRPGDFSDNETRLKAFRPDIVGISAMTQEDAALHRIAGIARKIESVRFVVAGGPHPSNYSEVVMQDKNIDFIVLGEGEETLPELIEVLESGRPPVSVTGIMGRDSKGETWRSEPRPFPDRLDSIPFPAWDLLDLPSYGKRKRFANLAPRAYAAIITSRGCPYQCAYCHNIFGKRFRSRSPENVIEEILMLNRDFKIGEFEILDDIFNWDKDRLHKICGLIRENDLRIRLAFPNGLRGDLLDQETITALGSAGTYFTSLAIESASPRIQKLIDKNLDLGRMRANITNLRKAGIVTLGFFMLGFPTETREEMLETIRFATESDLDFATFFNVVPLQGTRLEQLAREQIEREKQKGFSFQNLDYHKCRMNLSVVPDQEFFLLQRRAYRRFYLPRLLRIFFSGAWRQVDWKIGPSHFWARALGKNREIY